VTCAELVAVNPKITGVVCEVDNGVEEIIGLHRIGARYEDFQSSCRTATMGHDRSLLVSIQAFNGGLSRSILPIRAHTNRYNVISEDALVLQLDSRSFLLRQSRREGGSVTEVVTISKADQNRTLRRVQLFEVRLPFS
jgi:hypothetical protein